MVLDCVFHRKTRKGFDEFLFCIRCDSCGKIFSLKREAKFCSRSCINRGRKLSKERKKALSQQNTGENNPFFGRRHDETTRLKMSQRSNDGLCNLSHEAREKWKKSLSAALIGENNPFFGRRHDETTRLKMSRTRATKIASGEIIVKNRSYGGWFSSKKAGQVHFDSTWELIRMHVLDSSDEIIGWSRNHGVKIPYVYNETQRFYVPDFLVHYSDKRVLEEVKGFECQEIREAKKNALEVFCRNHGFDSAQIFGKDIEEMCQKQFGVSVKQFRETCKQNGVFS